MKDVQQENNMFHYHVSMMLIVTPILSQNEQKYSRYMAQNFVRELHSLRDMELDTSEFVREVD